MATNSAFPRYAEMATESINPVAVNDNPNKRHYLWYPGEYIPHTELPGGYVLRGGVTPVLDFPKWDQFKDVFAAGVGIKKVRGGTEQAPDEAQYDIPAHFIFEDVMDKYKDWGVGELTALENFEVFEVAELDIDHVFFPNGVPLTYREQRERIDAVKKELVGNPKYVLYGKIAFDMKAAIDAAIHYDTNLIDDLENNFGQPGYPTTYTAPVLRALARLERTRKDHAVIQNAARQNDIVGSLPALIAQLAPKGNGGLSAEQFTQLLAEFRQQLREDAKSSQQPVTNNQQQTRK